MSEAANLRQTPYVKFSGYGEDLGSIYMIYPRTGLVKGFREKGFPLGMKSRTARDYLFRAVHLK